MRNNLMNRSFLKALLLFSVLGKVLGDDNSSSTGVSSQARSYSYSSVSMYLGISSAILFFIWILSQRSENQTGERLARLLSNTHSSTNYQSSDEGPDVESNSSTAIQTRDNLNISCYTRINSCRNISFRVSGILAPLTGMAASVINFVEPFSSSNYAIGGSTLFFVASMFHLIWFGNRNHAGLCSSKILIIGGIAASGLCLYLKAFQVNDSNNTSQSLLSPSSSSAMSLGM